MRWYYWRDGKLVRSTYGVHNLHSRQRGAA
jgi:hypothetical protein